MPEASAYPPQVVGSSPLAGRAAIVTGAGRGIGAGVSEALLRAGASVMLLDRDSRTIADTARRLGGLGRVYSTTCDVADRAAVAEAVSTAVDRLGSVDLLVNNAQALRPDVSLVATTMEDLSLALDSGLWGTFNMMQLCYPYLARDGGAIVNFASSAGIGGQAGMAAYAATKEAIRGLSRVAAREWGPVGITVNVVCPATLSPAGQAWVDEHPDLHREILRQRAIPRDGDPVTDIGATVVFLAGPGARFITGDTFMVNGGYGMRP
jgi:NAD(P)-dependent dehydrogenase (short-subunit alcohol dehydrogenase family)